MDQILFSENNKYISNIPVSIQGIMKLPDLSFNPNSISLGNPWEKAVNDWILFTYISLIISGKVRISYDNNKQNVLSDIIGSNSKGFIPNIQHADFDTKFDSYLEDKIFTSIGYIRNTEQYASKELFKRHIQHLVNSILVSSGNFINPWKIIAEQIIKKDKLGYWTFGEEKKLFGLIKKTNVIISEKNKLLLSNELNKTEKIISILNKDALFNSFSDFLRTKINRAITSRQDAGD